MNNKKLTKLAIKIIELELACVITRTELNACKAKYREILATQKEALKAD